MQLAWVLHSDEKQKYMQFSQEWKRKDRQTVNNEKHYRIQAWKTRKLQRCTNWQYILVLNISDWKTAISGCLGSEEI